MSRGLRKCVTGLNTFSGFNTASHLNTAVFLYKSMSCKNNFLFVFYSMHITFYGTVQCLGEDGTWKQELVSAEINCGPIGTDISD